MARVYNSRKRILVTGGAGFLGSHLIDRLLSDGHEVLCVDNLFTGTKRNIEHLHTNPRFEFLRHDVTPYLSLKPSTAPRAQNPWRLRNPRSSSAGASKMY